MTANGFAHHPYGPAGTIFRGRDIVNMVGIRRLASALDKAARAGRISRGLGIYNTEFGYQTNPPDPFIGTTPSRQAEILNTLEEFSYRYPRLKSYSQYLLYDDPARTGPAALRWAGLPDRTALPRRSREAVLRRLPAADQREEAAARRPDLGPGAGRNRHPLRPDPARVGRRGGQTTARA